MASTTHFGIPKPDEAYDVDDEFFRLMGAWDLVDGLMFELVTNLGTKANSVHSHALSDIIGLTDELGNKMDAGVSFSLDDLLDVEGAALAAPGYVLVMNGNGVYTPASPAAAIGNHQHSVADIVGLEDELLAATDPWNVMPLGVPIPIFLHLPGVTLPPKDKSYRYVLLTAGMTGSGQYNQGVLINETVSGTAPNVTATATVNLTGSPFSGSAISLINSMKTFLRPGTSNVIEAGQNLSHAHTATAGNDSHNHSGTTASAGAHTHTVPYHVSRDGGQDISPGGSGSSATETTSSAGAHTHSFTTSTDTHTHSITVAADGGNENRPRNLNVQYILRIK